MTRLQDYTGAYIKETLEELLDEVVSSITSKFPEAEVILFGSYARGDYTLDSDLDFCVLVPEFTDHRLEMVTDIRQTLRRGFPLPKDILLYTKSDFAEQSQYPSRLEHTIKEEGRLLNA